MKETISKELTLQINRELFSAYQYLSMATWCSANGLSGCAHWFQLQSKEEVEHGMKIYNFLLERGCTPQLFSIEQPQSDFKTALEVFEKSLEQEKIIENHLNAASVLSFNEKDHVTMGFLSWFLAEQVEEISSVQAIVEKIKLTEGNKAALFMLDQELGARAAE